jgi:GxxExxY protein
MISDAIERIVRKIIGCAIEVHRIIGPGLLESVYRECLRIELVAVSLQVEADARAPLVYKGRKLRSTLKIDLLVEGYVVVELKAIEQIHPIHLAQVITYLKLSNCPVGLLMNFNATTLRAGLRRLEHPDLYKRNRSSGS